MRISEALNPKLTNAVTKRTRLAIPGRQNLKVKAAEKPLKSPGALPAATLYGRLVQTAAQFIENIRTLPSASPKNKKAEEIELDEICECMERVIESIESDPDPLLAFTLRSTPGDYLPGHIANVTVLSIAVAQQLKWERGLQRTVGVGAFLHDASLAKYRALYSKEGALSAEEKKKIQNIPKETSEFFKDWLHTMEPNAGKTIEAILNQTHERISGKGTPQGLKGNQIAKEAQLIGLVDSYEAMSHSRPYHPAKLPHEALRSLIELSGDSFDGALIKALWETLSLFPPGSYVKLNTGEIGKIISINKKNPTSPLVKIILSQTGEEVKGEKIMDLAQAQGVSIEKAADEAALKTKDPALALKLKSQKWWLK